MKRVKHGGVALVVAGVACAGLAGSALAQDGTLRQSESGESVGSARSGSAIGSAPGASGSTGMRRDPHSGTMVPNPERPGGEAGADQPDSATKRSEGGQQSRSFQGMAQVPAGIGERGTGQTQSTLERSGVGGSGR
jgi:hypothetical protein